MSANDSKDLAPAGDSETGGGAETPAQKLARLKGELGKAEADNEQLGKQAAALKGTIAELSKGVAELTKTVAEIDQRTKAWEKAAQALNQQKGEEEKYYNLKRPMLEATVPDKEFVIREKRKGEEAVAAIRERVKTLQQQETTQAQKLAAADAEAAQQRYEAAINLAQRNDAWLKDLAALHVEAEKEDAKNNVSRMFFHILEMDDVLKKLDIPSVEEFIRRVNEAQTAAAGAAAGPPAGEGARAPTHGPPK
jgi:chromosome segregation ATPase